MTQLHLSIVNNADQWRDMNISPACTAAAMWSCISRALAKMHGVYDGYLELDQQYLSMRSEDEQLWFQKTVLDVF